MSRDIPTLSMTVLKAIAKQPLKHLQVEKIPKSFAICPEGMREAAAQKLVDYISEAGRMTDEVPLMFPQSSTSVSIKNSKLSGKYIHAIVQHCPNLRCLDVSGCFQVTDEVVEKILRECTNLEILNFRNCRKVTDISLLTHINILGQHLVMLNIGGNFNITSNGLKSFLQTFPNMTVLQELCIGGLPINDEILQIIASKYTSLKTLNIAYAVVTERALRALLASGLGDIVERLNVGWITVNANGDTLSLDFFDYVAHNCPRLQEVDISGNRNINLSGLQQWIDFKIYQGEGARDGSVALRKIVAKFTCVAKSQLDQLASNYIGVSIEG